MCDVLLFVRVTKSNDGRTFYKNFNLNSSFLKLQFTLNGAKYGKLKNITD